MKLIDKDAIVAEIESRIKSMEECFNGKFPMSQSVKETEQDKGKLVAYKSILSFTDNLEVKEVDLNKEIDLVEDKYHGFESLSRADIIDVAKHFFELGLKARKGERGMKMYIIQEGYTCEVEDSFGDSRSENQACITAVATSREDVVKALAHSIFYNYEEYYDVSARDYQVHEVDVEVGKICFNNKGDFHGFWLTGEEKERVEAMVRELEKQKGEQ